MTFVLDKNLFDQSLFEINYIEVYCVCFLGYVVGQPGQHVQPIPVQLGVSTGMPHGKSY
jgi:hypothetical protein